MGADEFTISLLGRWASDCATVSFTHEPPRARYSTSPRAWEQLGTTPSWNRFSRSMSRPLVAEKDAAPAVSFGGGRRLPDREPSSRQPYLCLTSSRRQGVASALETSTPRKQVVTITEGDCPSPSLKKGRRVIVSMPRCGRGRKVKATVT